MNKDLLNKRLANQRAMKGISEWALSRERVRYNSNFNSLHGIIQIIFYFWVFEINISVKGARYCSGILRLAHTYRWVKKFWRSENTVKCCHIFLDASPYLSIANFMSHKRVGADF